MPKFRAKLTVLTMAVLLLASTSLSVDAKPRRNLNQGNAQQRETQSKDPYQKAKKDLNEDWYVLYRIVDRIARANGLDELPWRITVSPEYEINAFANENNLVTVYNGLLDQLGSDSSAIACVVGHEMAHHVKKHIALGSAKIAELNQKYEQEAEIQVKTEIEQAKSDATNSRVGFGILGAIGSAFGVNTAPLTNMGQQLAQQREAESQQRVQEIAAQKKKELLASQSASIRTQEFEADEVGYIYIATAGFDPKGCLRVMEVLGRTPGGEIDSTHPAVPKRIDKLNELMTENPPDVLADKGKLYLSTHKNPLSYELSKDGKSLRINSHKGSSAINDIDRQFGGR